VSWRRVNWWSSGAPLPPTPHPPPPPGSLLGLTRAFLPSFLLVLERACACDVVFLDVDLSLDVEHGIEEKCISRLR